MTKGFYFRNFIQVFQGDGICRTFYEFVNSKESEKSILNLNFKQELSEWERINIYLEDKRVIKNVFLYLGKYLFWTGYVANNGTVARFVVEEIVFHPNIFSKYNYSETNIVCIQM